MQQIAVILLSFFIIGIPVTALAHKEEGDKTKLEVKIKGSDDKLKEDEAEEKVKHQEEKLEINDQKFEISGEITAALGNNFTVLGQTVFIDPSQVREFEQKGVLEVGKRVKVEGIIKNGVKFAEEIKVLGAGQGRFKFEIKGVGITLPTIIPISSPAATITPTATISTTPSPSATSSSNLQVKVKAVGPIDQATLFLRQILDFLRNLS